MKKDQGPKRFLAPLDPETGPNVWHAKYPSLQGLKGGPEEKGISFPYNLNCYGVQGS
jgi:hypothetical protein